MPLKWTEPAPPASGNPSYYDHVIAETPLGDLIIEWKSWKEHGEGHTCDLPWDDGFVCGLDLDDAKERVQREWDLKVAECAMLTSTRE